jgi:hypothetical protein
MKRLVSEFHALNILELARGGWLTPLSTYDRVWRTHKGNQETSVTITVLMDALQLRYPMGGQRIQHDVQLTYSLGLRGRRRPWFVCPTCRRRVGVLYHGLPFRCRICCDLAYPSQYRSQEQTYGRPLRGVSHFKGTDSSSRVRSGHDDFEASYPGHYPCISLAIKGVQREAGGGDWLRIPQKTS